MRAFPVFSPNLIQAPLAAADELEESKAAYVRIALSRHCSQLSVETSAHDTYAWCLLSSIWLLLQRVASVLERYADRADLAVVALT